ncbi:UNVERIFIED_CONTAM: hypothetical protein GTU68_054519, partial [Idotea baltica]|nr:hypothetical protein [Idotea baltica]
VWEGCTPVFVDVHPEYLTIDETKIEEAITPNTTAILATHVFGNPCHVDIIDAIAKKHNLKVIYDAAHCFGVTYKNKSIFNYGDVSTCSFHATKLFHTGEGGAMFTNDISLLEKLFYMHNFGHKGKEDFFDVGINAKMSELQAALGLSVLPYIDNIISNRKEIVDCYNKAFSNSSIQSIKIRENTIWNYSYYPVIFETEEKLLEAVEVLKQYKITPRRYFYPSLNTLNYIKKQNCKESESIASRILCLPLYFGLEIKSVNLIIDCINK